MTALRLTVPASVAAVAPELQLPIRTPEGVREIGRISRRSGCCVGVPGGQRSDAEEDQLVEQPVWPAGSGGDSYRSPVCCQVVAAHRVTQVVCIAEVMVGAGPVPLRHTGMSGIHFFFVGHGLAPFCNAEVGGMASLEEAVRAASMSAASVL